MYQKYQILHGHILISPWYLTFTENTNVAWSCFYFCTVLDIEICHKHTFVFLLSTGDTRLCQCSVLNKLCAIFHLFFPSYEWHQMSCWCPAKWMTLNDINLLFNVALTIQWKYKLIYYKHHYIYYSYHLKYTVLFSSFYSFIWMMPKYISWGPAEWITLVYFLLKSK